MKTFLSILLLVFLMGCNRDSTTATLTVTGSITSNAARIGELATFVPFGTDADFGRGTGGADVLKLKLYKMYASTSTDCSGSVLVQDYGTDGTTKDLAGGGTLFEGSPPDGTYTCLALEISDNITFSPNSAQVAAFSSDCVDATEYTFDIYRTDSGDTWKDIDGNDITATGSDSPAVLGDDKVYIFATTNLTELAAGAISPHSNQTLTLGSSLTVPGSSIFYADSDGQGEGGGNCKLEGVTFGFR